jgi:serine O-acetyltransferase
MNLQKYIEFYFKNLFPFYPEKYMNDITVSFKKIKPVLIEDIRYYPHYISFDGTDDELIKIIMLNASAEAVVLYRIENTLFHSSEDHPLLAYLANMMKIKSNAEIYYSTDIGPGFRIVHSCGTVLGPRNKIGSNFSIYQNVTIGQKRGAIDFVTIGDKVQLSAGCKVIGKLNIGSNTVIGANAVLLNDAEPNSVYVGAPAKKVIPKK